MKLKIGNKKSYEYTKHKMFTKRKSQLKDLIQHFTRYSSAFSYCIKKCPGLLFVSKKKYEQYRRSQLLGI